MTDFEMVFMCLLIPVSFVMAYIAGKGDLLFVACKMLQEKLEEYTDKEIEPNKNPDGWIPVEERLPGRYNNILICQSDGYVNVGYYSLNEFKDMNSYPYKEVVAWMPLPAPYDIRKKEE